MIKQKGGNMSVRCGLRVVLLASVLSLGACTIATVTTPNPAYGIENSFTSHRFLWGIAGSDVNTGYEAVARVRVYTGPGDFLARLFTVGLYWPYSVDIWPADRPSNGGAGGGVFVQQASAPPPPASLSQPGATTGSYCSSCGTRVGLSARYCPGCGRQSQ